MSSFLSETSQGSIYVVIQLRNLLKEDQCHGQTGCGEAAGKAPGIGRAVQEAMEVTPAPKAPIPAQVKVVHMIQLLQASAPPAGWGCSRGSSSVSLGSPRDLSFVAEAELGP